MVPKISPRLGAALIMIALLVIPLARKSIFKVSHVKEKKHTGFLFLLKQAVGGLNFIFLSYFLATGKIPIVDSLAGFRYAFVLIFGLFLSLHYRHILDEIVDKHTIKLKAVSLVLIFFGTLILFL